MKTAAILLALASPACAEETRARAFGWLPSPPALSVPRGALVRVSGVAELRFAVESARPGTTILIADGTYRLERRLQIRADRVTLRGASGRRESVVLDGGGTLGEAIVLTGCDGVSVASISIQNVRWNGIKIESETGVQRPAIVDCVLRNVWQRGVKGTALPEENRNALRPTGGRIEGCLFENERPKRFEDDPSDTAENFGGNYVGGIDLMFARGWAIRGNVFRGIRGRSGEARGAVFLWHEARDCVVERNVIVGCDAGICLGNSFRGPVEVHAERAVVRNNFVSGAREGGLVAACTSGCRFEHNTVFDVGGQRALRLIHDNPGLIATNNLLAGASVSNESPSAVTLRNVEVADGAKLFVAPQEGDLRLKPGAEVERVARAPQVLEDIAGSARGEVTEAGAHDRAQ